MDDKRKKFLIDAANADPDCTMLGMFANGDSVNVYIHGEVQSVAEMVATVLASEPAMASAVFAYLASYWQSNALALAALEITEHGHSGGKMLN